MGNKYEIIGKLHCSNIKRCAACWSRYFTYASLSVTYNFSFYRTAQWENSCLLSSTGSSFFFSCNSVIIEMVHYNVQLVAVGLIFHCNS